MLTLGGIMKINRRLKALIYWMIMLGYFWGLFYLWMDYKIKSDDEKRFQHNLKIEPK
jgi:hypothetical protein